MSFEIYFDESHKIDKHTSDYAYYGILGWDSEKKLLLDKIASENKVFQRLHFSQFKLDKIEKYLKLTTFALENSQVNIYVVNTNEAFSMIENVEVSEEALRKGFYIKIPERLIYGMTRQIEETQDINIFIDHSSDYGSKTDKYNNDIDIEKIISNEKKKKEDIILEIQKEIGKAFDKINICRVIKEQLNSQALYRGLNYKVKKVIQKPSKEERALQVIDVILGIIVFLIEERYYEIEEYIAADKYEYAISKAECTDDDLELLDKCFKFDENNKQFKLVCRMEDLENRKKLRELNKRLKLYSQQSIQKSEFIYRLLSQTKYLNKFEGFNIFLWGNENIENEYLNGNKEISKFNISKYISKFLNFKYGYDNENKIEIIKIYLDKGMQENYQEKDYKNALGFGSNLKLLIRRYIDELKII